MTIFDYLAIAFSLVYALAAVRLLGGLPYALDPMRRYGVHVAFVLHELLRVTAGLWFFWSFHELAWTFGSFLLAFLGPALAYFMAATLVPEDPSQVTSWEFFYYDVRRRYFLGVLGWTLAVAATTTVLVGLPALHPFRLVQVGFGAFALVGAVSNSPRVHVVLAVIALSLPVVAWLLLLV